VHFLLTDYFFHKMLRSGNTASKLINVKIIWLWNSAESVQVCRDFQVLLHSDVCLKSFFRFYFSSGRFNIFTVICDPI
jgi:hypothetical protein